jgi:hypothetical protein
LEESRPAVKPALLFGAGAIALRAAPFSIVYPRRAFSKHRPAHGGRSDPVGAEARRPQERPPLTPTGEEAAATPLVETKLHIPAGAGASYTGRD